MRIYIGYYPLPGAPETTAVTVTDEVDCLPPDILKLTSLDLDEVGAEMLAEMMHTVNEFAVTYQVGNTFWELDV